VTAAFVTRRLGAERHANGFSCWAQFVVMIFCQLAQAKSIRKMIDGLACWEVQLPRLGLQESPRRSTLSFANARRPWQLYEAVFYRLLELAQRVAPAGKRFSFKLIDFDQGGQAVSHGACASPDRI
jgi:hypothetical protein